MLWKGLLLKTTTLLIFFLWLVKSLKKDLKKYGFFSDFQYGFRSSQSTADFLTVVSDSITRAFNRSGATEAVTLDISKVFDRFCHAGLLYKHRSYKISGQIFGLILFFFQ